LIEIGLVSLVVRIVGALGKQYSHHEKETHFLKECDFHCSLLDQKKRTVVK
jgi:hypothetical protein